MLSTSLLSTMSQSGSSLSSEIEVEKARAAKLAAARRRLRTFRSKNNLTDGLNEKDGIRYQIGVEIEKGNYHAHQVNAQDHHSQAGVTASQRKSCSDTSGMKMGSGLKSGRRSRSKSQEIESEDKQKKDEEEKVAEWTLSAPGFGSTSTFSFPVEDDTVNAFTLPMQSSPSSSTSKSSRFTTTRPPRITIPSKPSSSITSPSHSPKHSTRPSPTRSRSFPTESIDFISPFSSSQSQLSPQSPSYPLTASSTFSTTSTSRATERRALRPSKSQEQLGRRSGSFNFGAGSDGGGGGSPREKDGNVISVIGGERKASSSGIHEIVKSRSKGKEKEKIRKSSLEVRYPHARSDSRRSGVGIGIGSGQVMGRDDGAGTENEGTAQSMQEQQQSHRRGHSKSHSRNHSKQSSFSFTSTATTNSLNVQQKQTGGEENDPPVLALAFSFGRRTSSSMGESSGSVAKDNITNNGHSNNPSIVAPRRKSRNHSRQMSSISGIHAFSLSASSSSETITAPSSLISQQVVHGGRSSFSSALLPGGVTNLRAEVDSSSASGGSSSEDSPTSSVFAFGARQEGLELSGSGGEGGGLSALNLQTNSEAENFGFPISAGLDTSFSFPKRHFEDGMRFGVSTNTPKLSLDTNLAAQANISPPMTKTPTTLVVPSVSIVPSTPMVEDVSGLDFPFVFPNTSSDGDTGSDTVVSPDEAKQRFGAFSFGRTMGGGLSASTSSPVLGSAFQLSAGESELKGKRRHSHTRSTSISGHAFLNGGFGSPSGNRSRPSSPGLYSSNEDSPVEGGAGASSEELRRLALQALEGKREGLKLSVDWTSRENGISGQRNSWGNARRRQRSSVTEKVEISLPAFDDDQESSSGSSLSPILPSADSPKRESKEFAPPTSPSQLGFGQSLQATRRDMFGRVVPLVENAPFGIAGLANNGASPNIASQATTLRTLIEEDEDVDEDSTETHSAPQPETPQLVNSSLSFSTPSRASISPSLPSSAKFRPLRLLSISSLASNDTGSLAESRRSSSIDRGDTSLDSMTSPPLRALDFADSDKMSRRTSLGRGPRTDNQSRANWRRRLSGGSASSANTFGGSVKVLNEVGDADKDETPPTSAAMSSAPSDVTIFAPGPNRRRDRSSTLDSRSSIASEESSVGQESARFLLQRALAAEAENQAMREDIEGWQDRVRRLETTLDHERDQSRLLRERVRKLGDHLSSMSSMAIPPSSPSRRGSEDSSRSEDGTSLATLQSHLFTLAAAVESERREKMEALVEMQSLREELQRERATRELREEPIERISAPDVRPESASDGTYPILSFSPISEDDGPSGEPFSFGQISSFSLGGGEAIETASTPPATPFTFGSHPSPSAKVDHPTFTITTSSPTSIPIPSIPILLNDDGFLIDIPSGPPTPEPDCNAARIKQFSFPTGPVQPPSSRQEKVNDPFFDLMTDFNIPEQGPESATAERNTFGKVFGMRYSSMEEEDEAIFAGLPPIQGELLRGRKTSLEGLGYRQTENDFKLDFEAFAIHAEEEGREGSSKSSLDFSKSCSCCSGAVFDL